MNLMMQDSSSTKRQDNTLCPFSRAIIGKWCQCQHARLMDRCSGKMVCTRSNDLKSRCHELDEAFKSSMRFVLGVTDEQSELTHAQLMKIRCGGFIGMQRILHLDSQQTADVQAIIRKTLNEYNSFDSFPYNEIVQDIKKFKYRK